MPDAILPLADLALREGGRQAVALSPARDWSSLAAARDAWRDTFAAQDCTRVALYFADTFDFAAALLGAWAAGKTAVLPGDPTAGTCQLLRPYADIFAGEFPEGLGALGRPEARHRSAPSGPPSIAAVIFTSGSTGQPAAILKGFEELDAELRAQEATFGAQLGRCSIFATVSHQHIYGLLFKCLWPLASGRPFLGSSLPFPEQWRDEALKVERLALVSTPAHLKRLPPETDWAPVASRLCAVFSSGGPLPWQAALDCQQLLKQAPLEIYGSSETGGIAWRQRSAEQAAWTTLPSVEVAVDEASAALKVRSPHIHGGGWHQSADQVKLLPGGFELLGRLDRIAKIEEKRVSLSAIEQRLTLHAWVAEARALTLPGERLTMAAVVILKPEGQAALDANGKLAVNEALREHLAADFERVTLPRRWRYVASLPANSTGKVTQSGLAALFEGAA